MQHLNLEPLDPNTNLDDINIDLSSWEFGPDELSAGHPQPSASNHNARVLTSAEVHARRGKRIREEGVGESGSKRPHFEFIGSDPALMNGEQLASHLLEIDQFVSVSPILGTPLFYSSVST